MTNFDKTIFISHRVNSINELIHTNSTYGIELDIRDSPNGKLRITHGAFTDGEDLDEYLKYYNHKLIIFNVKSERIENRIIEFVTKYKITNYFFLDSSIPMIHQLTTKYDNDNIAVRFSKYEPIEFVMKFVGMVKWVWVDCFSEFLLTPEIYKILKNANFKICVVSPELQTQPEKIEVYKQYMLNNDIIPDAICCKEYNIFKWKN